MVQGRSLRFPVQSVATEFVYAPPHGTGTYTYQTILWPFHTNTTSFEIGTYSDYQRSYTAMNLYAADRLSTDMRTNILGGSSVGWLGFLLYRDKVTAGNVYSDFKAYKASTYIALAPSGLLGLDPTIGDILVYVLKCEFGCWFTHNYDNWYWHSSNTGPKFVDSLRGIAMIPMRQNLVSQYAPYIHKSELGAVNDMVKDMWFRGIDTDWGQALIDPELDLNNWGFILDEDGNLYFGSQTYIGNENFYGLDRDDVNVEIDISTIDFGTGDPNVLDIPILGDVLAILAAIYNLISGFIYFALSTVNRIAASLSATSADIFSFIDYFPSQIRTLISTGLYIFISLIILGVIRFVINIGGR